jgi:hypothetical protein
MCWLLSGSFQLSGILVHFGLSHFRCKIADWIGRESLMERAIITMLRREKAIPCSAPAIVELASWTAANPMGTKFSAAQYFRGVNLIGVEHSFFSGARDTQSNQIGFPGYRKVRTLA